MANIRANSKDTNDAEVKLMEHPWIIRRNELDQVQITFVDENHNTTLIVGETKVLDSLVNEIEAFKSFDKTKHYGRK